jgi:DoxX-like family
MTKLTNSTDCSRRRIIAYWVTTVIIAAEFAVGRVMDILRLPPFFAILKHLGYPGYFSVILGVWKVLGAAAALAPRFPRLNEWAYAGMFFNMTGAAASHLAVGDPAVTLVAPIIFTGLVIASWVLRPSDRRDELAASAASSRSAPSHTG